MAVSLQAQRGLGCDSSWNISCGGPGRHASSSLDVKLSVPPGNHYESTPARAADDTAQKQQSTLLTGEVKHSIQLGQPRVGMGLR